MICFQVKRQSYLVKLQKILHIILLSSEQVPSSVGLGVLVNPDNTILAAGGFIIQLMPGCDEETINAN